MLTFIILTPFIVLFVTGTRYDFTTHRFIKTGIIVADTDPKGATIYINNKEIGKSPKQIRFVDPGSYNLRIHKDGYFDWEKELQVRAQFVTYANLGLKNLILFYSNPENAKISDAVLNFYAGSKRLIYLTADEINITAPSSTGNVSQVALPQNIYAQGSAEPKIIASNDENYFLIYSNNAYYILDAQNKSLTDVSNLLHGTLNEANAIQFSNANNLYALEANAANPAPTSVNDSLYSIDWKSQSKTKVLDAVKAFNVTGEAIYYVSESLQNNSQTGSLQNALVYNLQIAQLPNYSNSILFSNLPAWNNVKIFVSPQNQVFIVGDGSLYAISENLKHIADFVKTVEIQNANSMLFSTNNEIDLYNPATQSIIYVTRSTKPITYPKAFPDLGWVFYINNNKIQCIEVDNRGRQNNYTLAETGGLDAKYYIDSAAKNIIYLNEGTLAKLKIR